jgi:hypothetical protein
VPKLLGVALSHKVLEFKTEVKAMRLVYVLGLGLLVSVRISGQSNTIVAGEYVEARPGEVQTCGRVFIPADSPPQTREPASDRNTGDVHES